MLDFEAAAAAAAAGTRARPVRSGPLSVMAPLRNAECGMRINPLQVGDRRSKPVRRFAAANRRRRGVARRADRVGSPLIFAAIRHGPRVATARRKKMSSRSGVSRRRTVGGGSSHVARTASARRSNSTARSTRGAGSFISTATCSGRSLPATRAVAGLRVGRATRVDGPLIFAAIRHGPRVATARRKKMPAAVGGIEWPAVHDLPELSGVHS